jgi:hypothetical protein
MSKQPNMLFAIEPWDLVANGYAETTMQILLGRYLRPAESLPMLPGQFRRAHERHTVR